MEQDQKQTQSNELIFLILISFGYFYLEYGTDFSIDSKWFGVGGVILIIVYGLYWICGHYIEKAWNQYSMWKKGIAVKKDLKGKNVFIPFDLKKVLEYFYKPEANQTKTFFGFKAGSNNKEMFAIDDAQRSQHLQVLGMTGTGKTESVFLPLIYQDALKKRPVIILDAKGEMSSINCLNGLLKSINREDSFLLFSLSHKNQSCSYNPLYVGDSDPQVIIDAFFNNFENENSFYRETSKTIFTHVFHVLHSLDRPFTPMDVYAYLTNVSCRNDVNTQVQMTEKGSVHLKLLNGILDRLTDQYKGWQHVVTGFINYLLDHSDPLLNDPHSDIVLTDVIKQRKVVYFQLPTNAYPIQAVSIAKMVQANLRYISSLIQTGSIPQDILVSIIIDEYAAFAEESFVEVLNKARSSGMMVTLAHQSLSDLKAISESFMKRIDENTLNKIYFKQTDPELCELIARSMGTYTKQEKTYKMSGGKFGNQIYSGESSNKTVHEFHFPPDNIKSLHKYGQGYFIYRADNSYECLNFGRFENIEEILYQKPIKPRSNHESLFEKYYLNVEDEKIEHQTATNESSSGALCFED